jgi:tripartite-type tricarboxylate transporter receptor subunit TctC
MAAEVYPARPVRVIVAFAPGGGTDLTARLVSQQLSEQTGKTFVVDNRAGASGTLGYGIAAKSPPDGYTLLLMDLSNNSPRFAQIFAGRQTDGQ